MLSKAIEVPGLWIDGGRIMTKTKRDDTYFAELSDGERTKIALKLGLDRVGKDGLLALEQVFWEGLRPSVQAEIDQAAKDLGVCVIAAQVSEDDELKADRFAAN